MLSGKRVKTGCLKCRARKKKCDEQKPVCGGCDRNRLECSWPATFSRIDRSNVRCRRRKGQHDMPPSSSPCGQSNVASLSGSITDSASSLQSPPSCWDPDVINLDLTAGADFPIPLDDHSYPSVAHYGTHPLLSVPNHIDPTLECISRPPLPLEGPSDNLAALRPSLFANHMSSWMGYGERGFHLLGHYLTRTASNMCSGFTPFNPFLTFLMPLALSNHLVLNLLLAQSAVHQAITAGTESAVIAQRHYDKSLSLFRDAVHSHTVSDGNGDGNTLLLSLGVSTLILCFTEAAKGDKHGAILTHLAVAGTLLPIVLRRATQQVSNAFRNFIIEYYVYTATLSIISMKPEAMEQFMLPTEAKDEAQRLSESGYTGNLCGCWLKLLLLIPDIVQFNATLQAGRNTDFGISHDAFAKFAKLQADILSWSPYQGASKDQVVSGRIYQQALLLYLYTCLARSTQHGQRIYAGIITAAAQKGMSLLQQLSPGGRPDTTLCWPIAVIGSCITYEVQQEIIRNRLVVMADALSFGNIERILSVLGLLWSSHEDGRDPWALSRIMQEHNFVVALC